MKKLKVASGRNLCLSSHGLDVQVQVNVSGEEHPKVRAMLTRLMAAIDKVIHND